MRKAATFALLTLALALSVSADERHQSYVSYDDGGTVVRTGDREVEATRNLPIYPGDEIVTARRGRSEVHLSDGNIIGIDRATAVRFRSILDSYEGESNETVAELKYGKVAVHRTDVGREHVRLDTDNASYVAPHEAVYSVETDTRGRDRVTVFDGSVEVRTPSRSTRLRRGESASVDSEGVYDLIGDQRYAADDFERWFMKRAERYGTYNNRYYDDRRIGYWSDDLDTYGRWVNVSGIGWSWRPFVAGGWRPYHNGYWYTSRWGCLTWVSHDPWGWAPWHYGRWAFDPGFGWLWVPGYSYSPAWVYWMYGPGYVGWAPAGWWDCHRPYYNWAYGPYRRHRYDIGFGFHGRVRVSEVDLRPWTFVEGNTLFSTRIDRAALTTDAIKQRLGRTDRSNDGFATISGSPARFTREEFRDPAAAIRRRGLGGDVSGATGAAQDLTPFIKRDPNLGAQVRDRIVRSRPSDGSQGTGRNTIGGATTIPSTGGAGTIERRGGLSPNAGTRDGGGSIERRGGLTTPSSGSTSGSGGIERRGNVGGSNEAEGTTRRDPVRIIGRERDDEQRDTRDSGASSSGASTWRDRVNRGSSGSDRGEANPPSTSAPSTSPAPVTVPRDSSWRNRRSSDGGDSGSSGSSTPSTRSNDSSSRGSGDVPARVIDRIGGARVTPRNEGGSSSSGSSDRGSSTRSRDNDSGGSRRSGGNVDRGSSGSSRDSGSRSSGGSSTRSNDGGGSRSSGGSSSGGSSTRSSDGGGSRSSGGSSSRSGDSGGGGGRIKRDN